MNTPPSPEGLRHRFEVINARHDVSDFHCEHSSLVDFLVEDAWSETQADLSRTYLLLGTRGADEGVLAGYFTLHADSIRVKNESDAGDYLYPLICIAALARDFQYKGKGIGDLLLIEAFRYAVTAAEIIGVAGIHLVATRQGDRLYQKYGFDKHPEGGGKRLIPISDVRAFIQSTEIPNSQSV